MPIIQQENGRRSVKGLPQSWGVRAYRELSAAQAGAIGPMPDRYKKLAAMLDGLTSAAIPLDSTDAQLCMMAERWANDCASNAATIHDAAALRQRMEFICRVRGVEPPDEEDDQQVIRRCTDPAWWRRNLRRVFNRMFEHAAIRLGRVSGRAGVYVSDETVQKRISQNRRNSKALRSVTMENEQGQRFGLDALASKGMGNKRLRKGELMLRFAGCEEIANERGDVGLFITVTCPSKFHAVLFKTNEINPHYEGATPRDAQDHLTAVWERTRAQNHRDCIQPYGLRMVEPHHDGCAHWHMVMFMAPDQVEQFTKNLRHYALEVDGNEPGAQARRVVTEPIDPAKGSAAGYLVKYVSKNFDDEHVGVHIDEDGTRSIPDLVGGVVITPAQRVEAWAAVWGIRQFQFVGTPPVMPWRETRRIEAAKVQNAPEHIKAAWLACQRETTTDEHGEVTVTKPADYAAYIRAQGGVNMGRDYLIHVATRLKAVEGRYGLVDRPVPTGIYCATAPQVQYASTRYEWRRVGLAVGVGLRGPWSPVNNCTVEDAPFWEAAAGYTPYIPPHDDSEWFEAFDFACFDQFGEFNPDLFTERESNNARKD
ncbi:replication endonuclease [Duganella sp. BuS-21]|uniref:replication endonuclease n=1 Tax=Duganella sp. BuS-21 TaxID=2943848 RepID=UPI0035A61B46